MSSTLKAILGPTNTGKTHYAIERMTGFGTGMIGLPLRLLAREVYDKIVAARGPSVVALITGEERIVPPRTQYWVCTVEACIGYHVVVILSPMPIETWIVVVSFRASNDAFIAPDTTI